MAFMIVVTTTVLLSVAALALGAFGHGILGFLVALVDPGAGQTSGDVAVSGVATVYELLRALAISLVFVLPLYYVMLVILLPAIFLHEFGHFVGMVKHDLDIAGYGFVFVGPLPLAAYMRPKDPPMKTPPEPSEHREIFSLSLVHDIVTTNILLGIAAAALFFGSPELSVDPLSANATFVVVLFFGVYGLFYGAFAILNTMPAFGSDGHWYTRFWMLELWGFHRIFSEFDATAEEIELELRDR